MVGRSDQHDLRVRSKHAILMSYKSRAGGTMDKQRIDVFISSTSIDLPEHRAAVRDAIITLGMHPSGMEHWPVRGENPVDLCRSMVADAEIYLGIYAHRYGWRPDGFDGRSITELEYDWAGETQRDGTPIPRLCFIMADSHPWPKDRMELDALDDLSRFKARVRENQVGFFSTPDDLKAQVIAALAPYAPQIGGRAALPYLRWLHEQSRSSGLLRVLRPRDAASGEQTVTVDQVYTPLDTRQTVTRDRTGRLLPGHEIAELKRGGETDDKLKQTSLTAMEAASLFPHLVLLGDPRPGVGVVLLSSPSGEVPGVRLPDIAWCEIPAGEFIYQDNERVKLPTYYIARYPITYAQFQAFLDAPDGFEDDRWWEGLTEQYRKQAMAEQYFKYDNHPRDYVSWYQAVAYCRWLTAKYDEHGLWNTVGAQGLAPLHDNRRLLIRLPTEAEWEKAARGTEGLIYPYGNEFDPAKGNTSETGIGQTSAVGLFPDGALPYGVLDMSGNVWEWCLNEYDHPERTQIAGDARRVLRGGSWPYDQYLARAAYRYRLSPYSRYLNLGFRVVLGGAHS
ncbi:MAG: DUF4062 domain-containing protein [Chloroflexi bacterium]|nr:DUF4062 domain-containing protein [Chloroflexota bacterium]MDL1884005.1 DUF4062 domain-containing protein [Anaerolineae bacterium CFX8]